MNQTVKIFFTDMDDTLLNSEKQVTKENMDAISEALAAGHKIVFNTGRPLSGFLPILKELGLDREGCYAIAFNGGLIYDCAAKKTLYRRTIPLKYARVIFEKTQEAGLYCHTYSDTSLLCRHAGEETRVYTQAIHIPVVEDPLLPEHLAEEPCKMIVIDLHDRAKMDAYRAAMETWAKGKISMFYSSPHYLEHVPEHVSKGHAVKKLCELLQIPLANTVAAGDQENDISMIEAAAVGAAMKNATDAERRVPIISRKTTAITAAWRRFFVSLSLPDAVSVSGNLLFLVFFGTFSEFCKILLSFLLKLYYNSFKGRHLKGDLNRDVTEIKTYSAYSGFCRCRRSLRCGSLFYPERKSRS